MILLSVKYEIILSDNVIDTCSMSCAEADWESSHSLLCTVESSDPRRREALLILIEISYIWKYNSFILFWLLMFSIIIWFHLKYVRIVTSKCL